MRSTSRALTATLGGLALLAGVTSCGQPSMNGGAVDELAQAPGLGLLQVRALHYIIDRREEGGRKLVSDVTVYSDGRVVVTAEMTATEFDSKGWISVRLSNLAGRTLWTQVVTTPLCVTRTCPSSRKETWTFRTTPRIANQASNLWLKLDILD
jgi:hypothetical protein